MLKLPARRFLHLVFTSNIAKGPANGLASMKGKSVHMGVDENKDGGGGGNIYSVSVMSVCISFVIHKLCTHIYILRIV